MSLVFNVVFAARASGTHHKLALDALRHLRGPDAKGWRDCLLYHVEPYLQGSKDPDNVFKDFRNHVLHVRENCWGGAISAATDWYCRTVAALRQQKWAEAAHAAGVLSHYWTDPLMPLHTGQTEEEGSIHRALEWSVAKSYEELRRLLEEELGGWPTVVVPASPDWLGRMVRQAAELANPHYETLIDHYNLAVGVKNPPAGLDRACQTCLARLLGHASVGFARILEQAFAEAAVTPPSVNLTVLGIVSALKIPVQWVTKKLHDAKERAVVQAMYEEFQQTGKVLQTLPEDDRVVRQQHAQEVLQVPLAELDAQRPRPVGTKHGSAKQPQPVGTPHVKVKQPQEQPAPATRPVAIKLPARRTYLSPEMPVEESPSIGPKTAERLNAIGVRTVADLLAQAPEDAARRLAARHITAATVGDWQAQARLMCRVPGLRCHDAQLMVGSGVRDGDQLASSRPAELLKKVEQFLATAAGERVLRGSDQPDLQEVTEWINSAQQVRQARAA